MTPKLTESQVALVKAMMAFARKTRQSWATRLGAVPGGERLSERDWTLLEWISEKGEVQFGDALKFMKGSTVAAGSSDAAITQAIGRMTKNLGLLRARRAKEDERKKRLEITKKGEKLMDQRREIREDMYLRIFATWEPLDEDLCVRLTEMFLRGIEKADAVFGGDG